ncbi:MAG: asparagine synthase (glutamine-hydrolyzing) [Desulfobulbaceae bacterium]|nr:asparagine synthase (glutamine-hydrolyzing) [Desulfobulbaceae bacterium]
MCGIAGYFSIASESTLGRYVLEKMIYPVTHRGPDGLGFYVGDGVGFAHARLSIVDLEGGWQPIHNEDKRLWVVFNGEIFNYIELRRELEELGHRFYTNSDTEVIVHLYEEEKEKCLDKLNGQFAIALYDSHEETLFLARDRMGIRPFFYTIHKGVFYFASEVKSLFASDKAIPREIDSSVLKEIFTFWTPCGSETVFRGIHQLEPGCCANVSCNGGIQIREYWDIPFGAAGSHNERRNANSYAEELRELLVDSVRLRLRADVPVGAYLSGGLDSSAITSLVRHYTDNPLKTFSVTFDDSVYDEQAEQAEMVRYLATDHHVEHCTYEKIGQTFPDVIWHTETPILRTAPTPLYLLSSLVQRKNYKVVLTGEGADEILGGYDIFKEAKIRAFIKRNADSHIRPLLLKRLYPYLALSPTKSAEYARKFFDTDASEDELFYAHLPRWRTTRGTEIFFSDRLKEEGRNLLEKLEEKYAGKLEGLDYFSRAQYLESKLLLGNYLLSSQGDRMAMAHSIEGRFPFLDHRVVEYACTIPPELRMKVLNEKNILKKAMVTLLPPKIVQRKKQPYMAPDILSFFGAKEADYLDFYLASRAVRDAGFFNPKAVGRLVDKCRKKSRQGFRENMAFVGILSTQIIYEKFVRNFQIDFPQRLDNIKIIS